MKAKNPYLSIIVPTGNDMDWYVPEATLKTEFCLFVLIKQLAQVSFTTEILIVDWNNNPKKKPLSLQFGLKNLPENVQINFIQVPQAYHRKYKHWRKRGSHISVASNVGLVRAKGHFLVCKAQDSLFSPELIRFIDRQDLKTNRLYRCNRSDVRFDSSVVKHNEKSIFDYCSRSITHTYLPLSKTQNGMPLPLHTNASGDFQMMARELFLQLRGYEETESVFALHTDTTLAYCAHSIGILEEKIPLECQVYKFEHPRIFKNRTQWKRPFSKWSVVKDFLDSHPNIRKYVQTWASKEERIVVHGISMGTWSDYLLKLYSILSHAHGPVLNPLGWGLSQEKLQITEINGQFANESF